LEDPLSHGSVSIGVAHAASGVPALTAANLCAAGVTANCQAPIVPIYEKPVIAFDRNVNDATGLARLPDKPATGSESVGSNSTWTFNLDSVHYMAAPKASASG